MTREKKTPLAAIEDRLIYLNGCVSNVESVARDALAALNEAGFEVVSARELRHFKEAAEAYERVCADALDRTD